MHTPTVKLTQDQIEFFHTQGYLSLGPLSTPDELAMMRSEYDRIFAIKAGRDRGEHFDLGSADADDQEAVLSQIVGVEKYAPAFKETLLAANVRQISQQLLGPDAVGGSGHAILKPARHGATTPWHQDEAYWDPAMEHFSISIWVPLQDVNLDNGCMHFVPGSHTLDVQPHHSINHDPRVHGLEIDDTPLVRSLIAGAVACPLVAGGATIHGGRMMHYAGPNRTDAPRRAYILMYATPARPLAQPRRFPWLEARKTARLERLAQARQREAGAVS